MAHLSSRTRAVFPVALIVFLSLGRAAAAQQKGIAPSVLPRIALTVGTVNPAPAALLPAIPAVPLSATLAVSADRNRADAALTNVSPTRTAQSARMIPIQRALMPDRSADVDFDGSLGGKKPADVPADGTGAVAAHKRAPSRRLSRQVAFADLQGPVSHVVQFLAAHSRRDPSYTRRRFAHTVRMVTLVTAMAKTAQESRSGRVTLLFSAFLREAALRSAANPAGLESPLRSLKNCPGSAKLFGVLFGAVGELESDFGKLLDGVIAASDIESDTKKSRREDVVSAALVGTPSGVAATVHAWMDRWGRRLAFAHEIAEFTGAKAEALKAAKSAAKAAGRPASGSGAAAEASRSLRALMDDPFFALVPRPIRAKVEKASRFLQSKSRSPSASGTADVNKDTSVEIEIHAHPAILNLLTTPDGTVGGLLGDMSPPENFAALYGGKAPKDVEWDPLSDWRKRVLLQHVARNKPTSFDENRTIPRVSMKKEVVLDFARETTFLGKVYPPGRHRMDISRVFRDVEYMSADSVNNVSDLELHFRDNRSAGKVSNDAWIFLDGLGVPRTHQHVHIVAPIPFEALERGPNVQAAAMGDFYRRVNLLAEMTDIVDEQGAIRMNVKGGRIFFGYARPDMVWGVTQYFKRLGTSRGSWPLGAKYKHGWVGFWGSDKYDEPGLYGLEYRSIRGYSNETDYREILDRIQRSMMSGDYGVPKEKIRRWLAKGGKEENAPDAVSAAWYNQDWPDLFAGVGPDVKNALEGYGSWRQKRLPIRRLMDQSERHAELKMLMHDWSNDPLVFEDVVFQKRILAQQARALRRFRSLRTPSRRPKAKYDPINAIVSDFLVDSGLYDAVSRSIGPAPSTR